MCRSEANGPKTSGGRAGFVTWALTALCVLAAVNSWAAPANDNFANAKLLKTPSVTGSNIGATKEPCEPQHAANPGGASVWWAWVAPFTGAVSFDTEGSALDTV